MKRKIKYIAVLTILLTSTYAFMNISASSTLFTLDPLPTVSREVAGHNSVDVSTAAELSAALNDQTIDLINMTNDIALPGGEFGFEINRDLRLNGNSHGLTVTGSHALSPNAVGGTLDGALFNLGSDGSNGVFHMQNISMHITTFHGTNALISTHYYAQGTWDVILDNFTQTNQNYRWSTTVDSPMFKQDATNLFFRNNVRAQGNRTSVFKVSGNIVVEPHATVNIGSSMVSGITSAYGTYSDMYIGQGATTLVSAPIEVIDSDNVNGGRSNISQIRNLDIYDGAGSTLTATWFPDITSTSLLHDSETHEMNVRIDNNATFTVRQARHGSAVAATSPYPLSIVGNPGSALMISSSSDMPTVNMGEQNSHITLHQPRSFNIQNNGTGIAITGFNSLNPNLILRDTHIGIWMQETAVAGSPTLPSPFNNATLIYGMNGPLEGTSPEIYTMPQGWNPANTSRIGFAPGVDLSANDVLMLENMNHDISVAVSPSNANLTFVSSNPEIISVDETGVLTSHTVGESSITITGSLPGFHPRSIVINAKVVDDELLLVVPGFSEINIHDDFDHMDGVSALDSIDGMITDSINIEGKVDNGLAGIHIVDYSVTNSRNNTFTARQNVLVNDGNFNHNNGKIISGNSISISKESADTITDAELIEKANIKVYNLDGNVHIDDPLIHVDRKDLSSLPGVYPVTFNYNPSITLEVTVTEYDLIDVPDNDLGDLPSTGHSLSIVVITLITLTGGLLITIYQRRMKRT